MGYLGMYALGIFVGGVVTLGLKQAQSSVDAFIKIMGAVLTATFTGAVAGFMDKYKVSVTNPKDFESAFLYPVGLLVALLWLYFEDVRNQKNSFLSRGGVAAIIIITLVATAIAISPAARSLIG